MQKRVQKEAQTQESLSIMLIENDLFQRMAIIDILQLFGHELTAFSDLTEVQDKLLSNDFEFDLIFLDSSIPEILNFLRTIKSIEKYENIPVIMIGRNNDMEFIAACLNEGAQDYLIKPISFQTFQSRCNSTKSKPKQNKKNQKATYQLIKNIGKGSLGTLELVKKNTDQKLYAMKVIVTAFMSQSEIENIEKELSLQKLLISPTFVEYYEFFRENENFNVIMEYAEGGSLSQKIDEFKKADKKIPKDTILFWMAQLVIAIYSMHSKNIIHGDVKPLSIFLAKDETIKLDTFVGSKGSATQFFGTPYYMAPEVIRYEAQGKPRDIWALGCVLYELVMLAHPFEGNSCENVFKIIQNEPYQIDPSVDQELQIIIEKTLQKDPNNRATIEDLANIPCIKENIINFAQKFQLKQCPHKFLHILKEQEFENHILDCPDKIFEKS